jgi:hypothetical protein
MSKSLLRECQRVADELGALMTPPATLQVRVEAVVPRPNKGEGPSVIAKACITSIPAIHQRPVQANSEGDSESEALAFLKAAIELKVRFVQSGSSGTRRRVQTGPLPQAGAASAAHDADGRALNAVPQADPAVRRTPP